MWIKKTSMDERELQWTGWLKVLELIVDNLVDQIEKNLKFMTLRTGRQWSCVRNGAICSVDTIFGD